MKNTIINRINLTKKICLILVGICIFSCNEDEFLKEVPIDFYSPINSYVSIENFDAALLRMNQDVRSNFYQSNNQNDFPVLAWSMTELQYPHKNHGQSPDVSSLLLPTNSTVVYDAVWRPCYKIIYDANVVIGKADAEESELTDTEKSKVKAEAMFYRGFALKMLANIYGGVPIVLEEISSPKRDFIRATRDEVYQQCKSDFEFAANNLPGIEERDVSRANSLAANHYLAEVLLSLGLFQDAVNAASVVIDHPSMALMKERFGTRVNDPNFGGDVYWDLFRKGNQSRSAGNTESIWVVPFNYNVTGGGSGGPGVRCQVPRLWQCTIYDSVDENGKGVNGNKLTPLPNENYYGRGGGFTRPSPYFFSGLWQKSDWNDMRNSEYNIVRDYQVNNPKSAHNGKWLWADGLFDAGYVAYNSFNDSLRNLWFVPAKVSTPGNFPKELYHPDQSTPGSLISDATREWKDRYVIRLAETYLLRAEAYLGLNNQSAAANDINEIRGRANAIPVEAGEVDIDYILDERLRELCFETLYLCTLSRLGKVVDRTKRLFPYVGNSFSDHHNLWPIPYDEIEKNTEAVLEQNPGY